jgi:hypothetical protein
MLAASWWKLEKSERFSKLTSMATLKNLTDGLNYQYIPNRNFINTDDKIKSIHFYPKIVFIIKGENRVNLPQYILQDIEMAKTIE